MRRRMWLLSLAIFFTLVPFSSVGEGGRGRVWVMLRDFPEGAAASAVLALGCWIAFGVISRRLRPTGL